LSLANTPTYQHNLAVLAARQPELADLIDAAVMPDGAQRATGRDGAPTATYLEGTRRVWLGATSTPRMTAEAQLGASKIRPGNVCVPGILSGIEALLVLERIAPRFAVFVIERRLELIKLAFHVHAYAPALDTGRLVFLREGALVNDLCQLLARFPGYEYPRHIWTALQKPSTEIESLQQALEQSAGDIERYHAEVVAGLADSVASVVASEQPPAGRIAVLAMDDSVMSHDVAVGVVQAAAGDNLNASLLVPDRPDRCHVAAGLQFVRDTKPELIIAIGGETAGLRAVVPESLPVVTWYLPMAAAQSFCPALGPVDHVLAGSPGVLNRLLGTGIPADRISLCPPGARMAIRGRVPTKRSTGDRLRVALFADLPDDRADACGISLGSHAQLWEALRSSARSAAEHERTVDLRQLLAHAQTQLEIRLSDDGMVDDLCACADEHILPVAMCAAVVDALPANACEIDLYGGRISQFTGEGACACGPIPSGDALDRVLSEVDCLVLPVADERAWQWCVDAMAAGVSVWCHSDDGFETAAAHSGFEFLLGVHWFHHVRELKKRWREFGVKSVSDDSAAEVRRSVHEGHTLADRLRWIRRLDGVQSPRDRSLR